MNYFNLFIFKFMRNNPTNIYTTGFFKTMSKLN